MLEMRRNKTRQQQQRQWQRQIKRSTRRSQRGGAICPIPPSNSDSKSLESNAALRDTYALGSIHAGSTWYVYKDSSNEDVVIKKIGPAPSWLKEEDIREEIQATETASKLGIGPRVHYWCIDKSGPTGYIVMDKIDGVSVNIMSGVGADAKKEITALLNRLYDAGIHYTDENPANIMYGTTVADAKKRFWIIDYGQTKPADLSIAEADRKFYVLYEF
jgi:hypothetical protein